jgi:hypothetical protein
MPWKRVAIALFLLASVAAAFGIVWLRRENGVTGLDPVGAGCVLVGLLGVILRYVRPPPSKTAA